MSDSNDLSYDINDLLGITQSPPAPVDGGGGGVRLTKANAKQLQRKVHKAIRRRNRMKYYLLFSKNIHWVFYWPSVILSAAAATTAFANWAQDGACQGISWINILSGVLAVLGAALTAINGAAKFPEKEALARDSVASWGKYADKYETLLNRPYRDHGDAIRVMEEAITEFAELEQKSPDIPTLVLKLYLRSSLAKEINDDDPDPTFNFESEPELLGGSRSNSDHSGTPANSDLPPLQKELQSQMSIVQKEKNEV